jgi:DNA/RNA-binding domain of Phe-tRNA-synthetase-like protein
MLVIGPAALHSEEKMMLKASASWKSLYPKAAVGVVALGNVHNPASHAELDRQKEALEAALREAYRDYGRAQLSALPSIAPYVAYYKRFKKTYHVLQQLESVALKGKPIPRTAALVEAMFMAELKNQLLTAGHDLDLVQEPVSVTVARGDEVYAGISGREIETKAGDMVIRDAEGILSSIVYGPDERTKIRPETQRVIFTVYAPAGIEPGPLAGHLNDLKRFVEVISPEAEVVEERIVEAG